MRAGRSMLPIPILSADWSLLLILVSNWSSPLRYRASLVWVGPPPRLDENCEDFPHHVGNVIMPFITKVDMDNERNVIIIISVQRGFSVEDFTRLVRGEMEPKPREDAAASSAIISPATVTATAAATVRSVSNCQN